MQEYNISDQQIHWLSQVIAKVNKAFVPEKEDDSHTSLYFDGLGKRLAGRWVDTPNGRILLSLNVQNRRFEWLNNRLRVMAAIDYINKELQVIEQDVSDFPSGLGLNADRIFKPLHFEIPDYHIQKLSEENVSQEGIDAWCKIRDLANNACLAVLGYVQAESEIRIWPHHFDTGIYARISGGLGIGFGLAAEDAMVGEPYFYLAGYGSDSPAKFENLPSPDGGKWITDNSWNGFVIPLSRLYHKPAGEALQMIKVTVKQALDWYLGL